MSEAVPADLTVDLFNQLIRLPFSDKTEIGRIAWCLRGFSRTDLEATVALVKALLMLGETAEARTTIDRVWPRRFALTARAAEVFLTQLNAVGRYRDVLAFQADSALNLDPLRDPHIATTMMQTLLWQGDLAAAEALDRQFSKSDWALALFRQTLDKDGLLADFQRHQEIVRRVVGDRQCEQYLRLLRIDEGAELHQSVFISGDRAACRALEAEIDAALSDYFTASGRPDIAPPPVLTTLVHDISTHWRQKNDECIAA